MKKIYFTLLMLAVLNTGFTQTVFLETFDGVGGPTAGGAGTYSFPSGWTLVNVDNRTPNAAVAYVNDAWERREDFVNNVADSAAYSTSYYSPVGAADDWMWTPAITVPANAQLKWNAVTTDAAYQDGYEVRIMTQPTNPTGSTGVLGNMVSASTLLLSVAAEASTWTAHTVSLSAYAGQSVKIAFRNNSNDKFLLLIDDVEVTAVVNNDVALTSVTPISEYTLIPLAQVPGAGYPISALVTNNGLASASQVSLAVSIYNSSNALVASGNSGSTTIGIGANATLTATNFLPTTADDYMVVYNLTMNPADQHTVDNRDTQYISITHSTYARDNGNVTGALGIGAGNGGYLGQDYILNVGANINYVQGYFTRGYTGEPFAAVVWDMVGGVPNAIVASTDTFAYPDDSARFYQLPIHGGMVNLPAGRYAVTFIEFDSTLALAQTDEIFTAGTTWVNWPTNPNGTWSNNEAFGVNFAHPYVVRPVFCETMVPNFTIVNPTCSQTTGSATINPAGGDSPYEYLWSTGSTTNSISGVAAGAYAVSVADAIGCSITATANIVSTNTTITATTSTVPALCTTNGSATVTPTNGTPNYTYTWSNGNTTANPTNIAAGNYSVTVTDASGCTGTASVSISVSSLTLSATTSSTQSSCTNATGSVTANISNGTAPYGYQWTGGGNTQTVSNIGAGNYTVTVSDVNGCTGTATATVGTPNGPSASATQTNVACAGGTTGAVNLTVTGGTAPVTFVWSNGAQTEDLSGVAAGSYTVTVNDVNNCSFVSSATVTEPAALSFTGTVTNASTSGSSDGSITLNITGGTPNYTTSPSSLTNLSPGTYNVIVTDNNGCTSTQSFTVSFGSGVNNISSINSVHVYPNPTSSELFVDVTLKGASDLNISVYSLTGTLVYNGKFNHILTQVIKIPVNDLASGVYTLQVTAPGETKTNKVVVQH